MLQVMLLHEYCTAKSFALRPFVISERFKTIRVGRCHGNKGMVWREQKRQSSKTHLWLYVGRRNLREAASEQRMPRSRRLSQGRTKNCGASTCLRLIPNCLAPLLTLDGHHEPREARRSYKRHHVDYAMFELWNMPMLPFLSRRRKHSVTRERATSEART